MYIHMVGGVGCGVWVCECVGVCQLVEHVLVILLIFISVLILSLCVLNAATPPVCTVHTSSTYVPFCTY